MKPMSAGGFTLIELLIVVVIVGVLASLATPVMDLIEKRRLVSAGEAIYGHLQLARSEAIKQGVNMHVNFQSDGVTTWCLGINNGSNCDCTVTNSSAADYCGIAADGSGTESLQVINSTVFPKISAPTPTTLPSQFPSTGLAVGSPVNLSLNFVRGSVTGLGAEEQLFLLRSPKGLELAVAMNVLGRVRVCSPGGVTNVLGYAPC